MGLRRNKELNLVCRKSTGESGGIHQGPWARSPGGLGPGPPGLGARPTRGLGPFNHKGSQITIFRKPPGGSLAKAWVSAETAASEVGTWREERKRVFTLSAFGNHPTRPPRSAD